MAITKVFPIATIGPLDAAISVPVAGSPFTFQMHEASGDFSAMFIVSGTVTTLSADLQTSPDGGTTWVNVTTAVLTAAGGKVVTPIINGALYRFNYTTASGSINVSAVSN